MTSAAPPATDRVSRAMKLGYGVGDFAANIVFNSLNFYLLYFYTDVFLIGAAAAGVILLLARLWDAFTDPIMGYISDHTATRWGRKRPYLLLGALPLGASFALMLASPPLAGAGARFIYGLATYILFCTAYTVVNIPYSALTADITLDADERSRLTGYRMTFALLGTLTAAGATKPLLNLFTGEAAGFRGVGLIYGAAAALVTLVSFLAVRERVAHREKAHVPFRENLPVILANKPFLLLAAAFLLHMTAIIMVATMLNYFFKYNLQREELQPVALMCLFITAIAAIPLWVFLAGRKGKKSAYNLGMGLLAAALVALFFAGGSDLRLIFALCILGGAGLAANYVCPWSMVADTVEYAEWRTGLRREGIIYGLWNFGVKVAMAAAGFIPGAALGWVGYVPNIPQSEGTLTAIRVLMSLVPAAFIGAGITLIGFYPLDAETHRRIIGEIANQKEK